MIPRFERLIVIVALLATSSFAADRPIRQAAFHPDGRFLLTVGEDRFASVWDLATDRELAGLSDAPRRRSDWFVGALSKDLSQAVCRGAGATVELRDTRTGSRIGSPNSRATRRRSSDGDRPLAARAAKSLWTAAFGLASSTTRNSAVA